MINILGFKRVAILCALLAINCLILAGVYSYVSPEKSTKNNQLKIRKSEVAVLHADVDRMRVEFSMLEDQKSGFEALRKKGFFNKQGRREAELVLQEIQEKSGVTKAIASIAKGEFVENSDAEKANHRILESPISITIESLDDSDVYNYIRMLQEFFPGHLSINNMSLVREANVSEIVLRAISNGENPALVKADLQMTWRTMVSEAEEDAQ